MIRHWLIYLAVLFACTAFSVFYTGWLAQIFLLSVLLLPFFSLLVSLPAMLTVRLGVQSPTLLQMGDQEFPKLDVRCKLPAPPIRGQLRITHTLTGKSHRLKPGFSLPTDHCGQLICTPVRAVCFDYLGLFRLGVFRLESTAVTVRPLPLPIAVPADLQERIRKRWFPKPGGGFSENHEIRLYRPGDSLNQIHWKLTAKTGKLVIREAMAFRQDPATLTVVLRGSAQELDRKIGRILWAGKRLLEQNIVFSLLAATGDGDLSLPVTDEASLMTAVDTLLRQKPADKDAAVYASGWVLPIGGDADEA